MTPARSLRRSSSRSAPSGSLRRGTRPRSRTSSLRGDPVNLMEVEADDVTTPRVEIHSPSSLSKLSLRGDTSSLHNSPPLSLRCQSLQQDLSLAGTQTGGLQTGIPTDHSKVQSTPHNQNIQIPQSSSKHPTNAHATPQSHIQVVGAPHTLPPTTAQVPTLAQPHTGTTVGRTALRARTASHTSCNKAPHGATLPLAQLAAQVHSPTRQYQHTLDPQGTQVAPQVFTDTLQHLPPPPQGYVLSNPTAERPQGYQHPQYLLPSTHPQTLLPDPSTHPQATSSSTQQQQQHSTSQDKTSINLFTTFW